ncbi:excalibur calcium-binding domain-containing protein [Streptomyces agglomeratus]|uniref:excalibur calcium-binding domain-containing protein n=1 Tax=Streptomyces agglomeratus TaxID=285458 RepID=UPI000AAA7971
MKGTDLHTPTPTPTPTRDRSEGSSSSTGGASGGGGGSVHYRNCDAAKAAGAAPVHRGDPGYGPHLDRDGDGSACES